MKFCATLLIVALAVIAFAEAEDDLRTEYCMKKNGPISVGSCMEVLCNKENTVITANACAEAQCPGEVLRVEEDLKKPYPGCCPKLICKP